MTTVMTANWPLRLWEAIGCDARPIPEIKYEESFSLARLPSHFPECLLGLKVSDEPVALAFTAQPCLAWPLAVASFLGDTGWQLVRLLALASLQFWQFWRLAVTLEHPAFGHRTQVPAPLATVNSPASLLCCHWSPPSAPAWSRWAPPPFLLPGGNPMLAQNAGRVPAS